MVVYKITNLKNGKIYIGSTTNYSRRKKDHIRRLYRGNHHSPILQASYNKYGEDNFVFTVIEFVDDVNCLLKREQFWIDTLNPDYNTCTLVVGTVLGLKQTLESRRKQSKSRVESDYTIYCLNNKKTYELPFDCTLDTGVPNNHIRRVLFGTSFQHKGWVFLLEEDKDKFNSLEEYFEWANKERTKRFMNVQNTRKPIVAHFRNGFVKKFGSIKEAARNLPISKATICNILNCKTPQRDNFKIYFTNI